MSSDSSSELKAEIGHVLFVDIVGYSKLLINEQTALLEHLKGMVRGSEQVRAAEAEGKVIRLATGDGMALVFRNNPEAPAQCAVELARADQEHPELQLRMGIHSGPINEVTDVNERANVTGAGINMAQRVMDCGDAGHILLSKHVAEDLEQYPRWRPYLHELGDSEVKHGVRVGIVNFYRDDIGNPQLPKKFQALKKHRSRVRWGEAAIGLLVLGVIVGAGIFFLRRPAQSALAVVEKSVAVLPFANEGGDKDQQYFSDGLSEDFITALSQFAGLKVIGRNSAFHFRDSKESAQTIGAKLGVAHLLEGSVRRAADTVRISAELINASDGSTLWSQHYDRPYKDLFALQDDITHAVASALQARLMESGGAVAQSDRPPNGNLAAYTAYLQGKFYYARATETDMRQAITQYQAAIKDDPHYALAWAELSHTWTALATAFLSGPDAQQAYTKARAAANTALALEPNLAAAHVARGYVLVNADFDWTGAQAEYQRAVQLAPKDGQSLFVLGNLQAALGHPERAVALTRQALATDPLHANWYNWLANYLSGLGRLDEAAAAIQKAIELQPAAVSFHARSAIIEIQRGNAQAALAAAQTEPATGGWQEIALALARQIGPDRAAADAALKHLIEKDPDGAPYQIAQAYALRRDPDQMFAWLDRAWTSRDPGITYLLTDPFILRYQHDPRFAAFCQKVGLPTSTDAKAMP